MSRTGSERGREQGDSQSAALPNIPDKHYFTIGEVSTLCDVKQHVLRYWEKVFPQLRPDRRVNRRYYRRADLLMVRRIRSLLYEQGYAIKGVRKILSSNKPLNVHHEKEEPVSRQYIREQLRAITEILERTKKQIARHK